MNLLESLKSNSSVQIKKEAKNWQEAIRLLMAPLYSNGAIEEKYIDAIINRTKEIGPFYILAPGLAMPHERGIMGAKKDAFSFLTLKEPVKFDSGEEVDIFIGFSATNDEVHVAEAIPQIVMMFEDDESFEIIRNIKSNEELYEYIQKVLK